MTDQVTIDEWTVSRYCVSTSSNSRTATAGCQKSKAATYKTVTSTNLNQPPRSTLRPLYDVVVFCERQLMTASPAGADIPLL